jgi:hypothetical protein
MPKEKYSQWPILAFIMQPQFKFQFAANHTGHLILAQKGQFYYILLC